MTAPTTPAKQPEQKDSDKAAQDQAKVATAKPAMTKAYVITFLFDRGASTRWSTINEELFNEAVAKVKGLFGTSGVVELGDEGLGASGTTHIRMRNVESFTAQAIEVPMMPKTEPTK